jgi:hypothetical protein
VRVRVCVCLAAQAVAVRSAAVAAAASQTAAGGRNPIAVTADPLQPLQPLEAKGFAAPKKLVPLQQLQGEGATARARVGGMPQKDSPIATHPNRPQPQCRSPW